jgi:hypothetical protein
LIWKLPNLTGIFDELKMQKKYQLIQKILEKHPLNLTSLGNKWVLWKILANQRLKKFRMVGFVQLQDFNCGFLR